MQQEFTRPFQWILENRHRWVFHLAFWIFIYLDEILSLVYLTPQIKSFHLVFFEVPADMALVYINLYFLIPQFLIKRNIWEYLALTLLTIYLNVGLMMYLYFDWTCLDCDFLSESVTFFLSSSTLVGTAAGIKIFKMLIKNQQRVGELENAQLSAELKFLKNQINPHFLFNALNNIYVQSKTRPEETPDSILLISDLLRYQLYDCTKERVSLEGEIKYLRNYLQLDRMRRDHTNLSFEVIGSPKGLLVAPFLFLPFVENAVKYCDSSKNDHYIHIQFQIHPDQIEFNCENNFNPSMKPTGPGGIGLQNVKRRLALLYPKEHKLDINTENGKFTVTMILQGKKIHSHLPEKTKLIPAGNAVLQSNKV
ncbi:MAG: sensor histidine kinase [Saprospiraceae bacterium]|nr:sensor histidine kinase [Saprospiraceae bacterium]